MLNPVGIELAYTGVGIFVVTEDPNSAPVETAPVPGPTTYASKNVSLRNCAVGSLALRSDVPALYQKTGPATYAAPTGTWTQIT